MRLIERRAIRAILLTPDDRVLLMRVDYGGGDWWITPGGGTEPGETAESTLRRELFEELGHTLTRLGPLVWRRIHTAVIKGNRWRQSEDYHLMETAPFTPAPQNPPEVAMIREYRWWDLPALRQSRERIAPEALARIIMDFRNNGAPSQPPPSEITGDQA